MLKLTNISKTFPGVKALSEVSFTLNEGEVHALCGENGAGKSTLMNILSGNLQPDKGGDILLNNKKITIQNFNYSRSLGIAIVYQERSLIDALSIAENIFANRSPKNRWGFINFEQLFTNTKAILNELDLDFLNPNTLVGELSPAEKQMVEIGKALSQNPKILILDEATASITEKETQTLFKIIKALKSKGVGIIYISHRLAEIFEITDTVTVLKDGKHQITQSVSDSSPEQLIKRMVGRDIVMLEGQSHTKEEIVLEVQNLSGGLFQDCSLQVKRGEIVALAGLVGAGRSEVARAIFGIDKKSNGAVKLNGNLLEIKHPADAIAQGIGYVPEDRKSQGLFMEMSVKDNILAGAFGKSDAVSEQEKTNIAQHYKAELRIQTPSLDQTIGLLSGGNQQKCILARWLHLNPKVLIVDEPTHGIDVGAKFEIYQLLRKLAEKGTAIILISSELPEVLILSDRILVMHLGEIKGELSKEEATEENILALAS